MDVELPPGMPFPRVTAWRSCRLTACTSPLCARPRHLASWRRLTQGLKSCHCEAPFASRASEGAEAISPAVPTKTCPSPGVNDLINDSRPTTLTTDPRLSTALADPYKTLESHPHIPTSKPPQILTSKHPHILIPRIPGMTHPE
jgi:hypothetical protein